MWTSRPREQEEDTVDLLEDATVPQHMLVRTIGASHMLMIRNVTARVVQGEATLLENTSCKVSLVQTKLVWPAVVTIIFNPWALFVHR